MRKICSHEAWNVDFTTRKKRIFRPQNVENFYTLRGTLKRWFHESAEIAFSGYQNAEVWYMRKICTHEAWCRWNVHFTTAHSAFEGMKNEDNFLTHSEDAKKRKICSPSWTLGFTTRQKSNFLASKMEKNELKNARCPLNPGFRNSSKSHFQALKKKRKSAGLLPSIDLTLSINRPSSFHQFTIQFPSIEPSEGKRSEAKPSQAKPSQEKPSAVKRI